MAHNYIAIPVLNKQEQYVGIVTEDDFLRHLLAVLLHWIKTFFRCEWKEYAMWNFDQTNYYKISSRNSGTVVNKRLYTVLIHILIFFHSLYIIRHMIKTG